MITEKQQQEFLDFFKQCRQNYIPVVRPQTAHLLCDLVAKQNPKTILELGTAVGYSGTLMLLSSMQSKLTTVDINGDFCKKAEQTFKKYGVFDRVKIVNDDALNFLQTTSQTFDFIFVDGPKGQYIKYYPYLKKLVNIGGIVVCDDVLYFGMVQDDSKVIHKKITIIRNLREFLSTAQNDMCFDYKLLQIEDGVLVLTKKHSWDLLSQQNYWYLVSNIFNFFTFCLKYCKM